MDFKTWIRCLILQCRQENFQLNHWKNPFCNFLSWQTVWWYETRPCLPRRSWPLLSHHYLMMYVFSCNLVMVWAREGWLLCHSWWLVSTGSRLSSEKRLSCWRNVFQNVLTVVLMTVSVQFFVLRVDRLLRRRSRITLRLLEDQELLECDDSTRRWLARPQRTSTSSVMSFMFCSS